MTGPNAMARGGDSGWGGVASLPPKPQAHRPTDSYIPSRPRSPPPPAQHHQRWDSPPDSERTGQAEAGPSNYARQPPSTSVVAQSAPSHSSRPAATTASTSTPTDGPSILGGRAEENGPIVPMKFKPKLPKPKGPIRPPDPPMTKAYDDEEMSMNGQAGIPAAGHSKQRTAHGRPGARPNEPKIGSTSARSGVIPEEPPRPAQKSVVDEKEDFEIIEYHNPDPTTKKAPISTSSRQRQDGGTIDESRNDGVLVMW